MQMIGGAEMTQHLSLADWIAVMRQAMCAVSRGEAVLPPRWDLPVNDGLIMGMKPGALAQPACHGVKLASLFSGTAPEGASSHQGVMVLFDSETGAPVAVLEGARLTAIRTAAVSVVATRELASPAASVLAVLGAGEQADWHIRMMLADRRLTEIRIWNRSPVRGQRLADAYRAAGVVIRLARTVEEAVDGAEIVCTTTASPAPIVQGRWLRPGQHLNLIGASIAATQEIDEEAVVRSRFYVDSRPTALLRAGEFLSARASGTVDDTHIVGEIGDVLLGRVPGRTSPEEITIYKSLGLVAQDLAAAWAIYEKVCGR